MSSPERSQWTDGKGAEEALGFAGIAITAENSVRTILACLGARGGCTVRLTLSTDSELQIAICRQRGGAEQRQLRETVGNAQKVSQDELRCVRRVLCVCNLKD